MARLALPLLVLNLTHSIAAVATLRVVQSIPYILFGAPAGALIDRVDKRQLSSPATSPRRDTAATPRSAIAGMFSSEPLYLIGFPLGTVEVLWGVTTDFSVIPSLVEERELADANAVPRGRPRGTHRRTDPRRVRDRGRRRRQRPVATFTPLREYAVREPAPDVMTGW